MHPILLLSCAKAPAPSQSILLTFSLFFIITVTEVDCGLPLTWTSVGDVETALFMITVGLGVSGESVGITFLTQWMLPRAVFLGRVIACFVLFPTGTGTATQGILWFYISRQTFTNVQLS